VRRRGGNIKNGGGRVRKTRELARRVCLEAKTCGTKGINELKKREKGERKARTRTGKAAT